MNFVLHSFDEGITFINFCMLNHPQCLHLLISDGGLTADDDNGGNVKE
jgi:hypothetical protein